MMKKLGKKETTRHKIMDCFWELFVQKSIDKITVSEITTKLNINRSTFYAHFKDVYDVLDQLENRYLPTSSKLLDYYPDLKDPEESYQAFLHLFDASYAKIAFLLSDHGDPNFERKLKNWIRPAFRQNIPKEYHSHKCFDLSVEFVLSSMLGVFTYWANNPTNVTSRELFDHLHNMYVYGVPKSLGITTSPSEDTVHSKPEHFSQK